MQLSRACETKNLFISFGTSGVELIEYIWIDCREKMNSHRREMLMNERDEGEKISDTFVFLFNLFDQTR